MSWSVTINQEFIIQIRVVFSSIVIRSPLGLLRDMIFCKTFVLPWLSGVPKHCLPCFVDATLLRVAGIMGKCFSRSLSSRTLIFAAELCAALGIYYHIPNSNWIDLYIIS